MPTKVRRIEALADGITRFTGWTDPTSEVYQARNPGALKPFSMTHPRTDSGLRVFKSEIDGFQALLRDLEKKICTQERSTSIDFACTLNDLILAYGWQAPMTKSVAKFLRQALSDESITQDTLLAYFME